MNKKLLFVSGGIIAVGVVLLILFVGPKINLSSDKIYGEPIDLSKGETVELKSIIENPRRYEGKNIIVEGKTGPVCRTSGCWVILIDDANRRLFVQFYTFQVWPPGGSNLRIQGTLNYRDNVPVLIGDGLEILP